MADPAGRSVLVVGGSSTTVHGNATHTGTVVRLRLQHASLFELCVYHAARTLPWKALADSLPPSILSHFEPLFPKEGVAETAAAAAGP